MSTDKVKLDDLRSVRKALNRSQSELAELLGMSTRAVQSYEQGWRPVPQYVQKLVGVMLFLKYRQERRQLPPCWKLAKCDPRTRSECFAYQSRAGGLCWLVTGCSCGAQELPSWREKLARCRKCPVMKPWLGG